MVIAFWYSGDEAGASWYCFMDSGMFVP